MQQLLSFWWTGASKNGEKMLHGKGLSPTQSKPRWSMNCNVLLSVLQVARKRTYIYWESPLLNALVYSHFSPVNALRIFMCLQYGVLWYIVCVTKQFFSSLMCYHIPYHRLRYKLVYTFTIIHCKELLNVFVTMCCV